MHSNAPVSPHFAHAARTALAVKLAYARSLDWFVERCPAIVKVQDATSLRQLAVLELEGEGEERLTLTELAEFSHRAPGGGLTLTSGGSTGGKKQITHSWLFHQSIMALGGRGFAAAAGRPTVLLNCLTAGEMQGAFLFACGVAEQLGVRVLPAGWAMHPAQLVDLIATHQVDTLVATPSFAAAFLGDEKLPRARLVTLRQVLFIGEAFSAERRQHLVARFPELVIRSLGYSSTETGPIGFQCGYLADNQYHLHADVMHVEVLDPESLQPVAEGAAGELVVTPLLPDHVPLFRYRIGDLGQLHSQPHPCACGSPFPLLTLLGRAELSIKLGGAIITQRQVLSVLRKIAPELTVEDVQVQYTMHELGGVLLTLALSDCAFPPTAGTLVSAALANDEYAHMLLKLPGVAGLNVVLCPVTEFRYNCAGKRPFFIQTE